uniref:Alanine racemase n=1 Tax=Paulinella micropora TaxID=1928728 RepID=A0A385I0P2_9EUKA|nr:alanine racemase [Paulinella micropora]AXY63492.1 alanine racemase [Paulinella micropora]
MYMLTPNLPFSLRAATHLRQRAWVEIDRAAISSNTWNLRRLLGPKPQLMAVVKADGYGHGALNAVEAAQAGGASGYGVATLNEGIQLREGGIKAPVLVLGSITQPEELRACQDWKLMPTVSTMREVLLCESLAKWNGRIMPVHIKIDTGMTRLGVNWEEGIRIVKVLKELNFIRTVGVYTHLAITDKSSTAKKFTQIQKQRFLAVLNGLSQYQIESVDRHLANSAGTLSDNNLYFDMTRVGLAIYGQVPQSSLMQVYALRPALHVRARITLIRQVPAGVGISYNHKYVTVRKSTIAVVSIGYGDGVPRLLSGKMEILFKGKRLPQVGSITMDQLMVDATNVEDLRVGSVVTLLGTSGNQQINAFDWSQKCNTIPWEILCGFKDRLPRLVLNSSN